MKIISKYKDYYDYLQGIYGIDEIMVYDRRVNHPYKFDDLSITEDTIETITFAICNKKFVLYYYGDKFYHTPEELVELHKIETEIATSKHRRLYYGYGHATDLSSATIKYNKENCSTNINKKLRQPVLIQVMRGGEFIIPKGKYHPDEHWSLPILDTFKVAKYIPADIMYQNISAFIGWLKDHPELPDNQTNDGKIISAGFDLKNSFRPNKKN